MNAQNKEPVKQLHPLAQLRHDLKVALPTFGLPNVKEQERMSSVLMVAVEKDVDLMHANRASLIAAVRQCANHGLVPDGNEATLQIYNTKVKLPDGGEKWIKKVQYQPMVRGIINRILRSGKVDSIWAELVYAGESFSIDISGGDRRPKHEPDYFNRTGEIIGCYAVAKMANGSVDCEPVTMSELAKIRAVAKTKKVWDGWFEEKAKVATIRRMSKRLPLSSEDMAMIMNEQEHEFDVPARDITPERGAFAKAAEKARLKQIPQEENTDDPIDITPKEESQKTTTKTEVDDDKKAAETDAEDPSIFFDLGYQAAQAGLPRTECPCKDDPDKAILWQEGWDEHASENR